VPPIIVPSKGGDAKGEEKGVINMYYCRPPPSGLPVIVQAAVNGGSNEIFYMLRI